MFGSFSCVSVGLVLGSYFWSVLGPSVWSAFALFIKSALGSFLYISVGISFDGRCTDVAAVVPYLAFNVVLSFSCI